LTIALGVTGFTRSGTLFTRNRRLTGRSGKLAGAACLLFGTLFIVDGAYSSVGVFGAIRIYLSIQWRHAGTSRPAEHTDLEIATLPWQSSENATAVFASCFLACRRSRNTMGPMGGKRLRPQKSEGRNLWIVRRCNSLSMAKATENLSAITDERNCRVDSGDAFQAPAFAVLCDNYREPPASPAAEWSRLRDDFIFFQGGRLITDRAISVDGLPGRELVTQLTADSAFMRRTCVSGRTLFHAIAVVRLDQVEARPSNGISILSKSFITITNDPRTARS